MNAEQVKQALLEYGWDAAERRRIAHILDAAATDPECAEAVAAYDAIRAALRPLVPAADTALELQDNAARLKRGLARGNRRLRVGLRLISLAAALLLMLGAGWTVGQRFTPRNPADHGSGDAKLEHAGAPAAETLAFSPQDIGNATAVYQQVAGVFDQRASWVLVSQDASDIGVAPAQITPHNLVLLRLAVCRDNAIVSCSDLVVVPGQDAELTVPFPGGQRLRYEIHTSAEAVPRLSLWAKLQGPNGSGRTLAALATDLPIAPGQVRGAGEMVTTSGNYVLKIAFAQATAPAGG